MSEWKFTNNDFLVMKIDITLCFAERFGMSLDETLDLFESREVYDYLDRGGDQFITKSYPYMVSFLADYLGIEHSCD